MVWLIKSSDFQKNERLRALQKNWIEPNTFRLEFSSFRNCWARFRIRVFFQTRARSRVEYTRLNFSLISACTKFDNVKFVFSSSSLVKSSIILVQAWIPFWAWVLFVKSSIVRDNPESDKRLVSLFTNKFDKKAWESTLEQWIFEFKHNCEDSNSIWLNYIASTGSSSSRLVCDRIIQKNFFRVNIWISVVAWLIYYS